MIALGDAVLAVGHAYGSFAWPLAAMVSVGVIVPLVNGPVHAILQATIAPEYQGRVFALLGSLAAECGSRRGSRNGRCERREGSPSSLGAFVHKDTLGCEAGAPAREP
jgi:hypothetical protein